MLQTAPQSHSFTDFVLAAGYDDIPEEALERVQDLILDLIGVAAAATDIEAARIGREMALRLFNAGADDGRARILFDGRSASLGGAAYAGATQIDSLDAHDGYSPSKGHAGCGLLPGVLAFAEHRPELSGRDFLATMVLGYEIACRAGVALHGTVPDYHTSGAWVAVAVAALGVRLAGGDADTVRQAIGIAEYHGPRSQMMREIDNPTMLHDGSGWGAMVGVTSAELALAGFAGAPALTVESDEASSYWADLGRDWLVCKQNIKLFPVCRWAHAPIQAAFNLRAEHGLKPDDIAGIEISSFHNATRLALDIPQTTGKAQYSISYPVAAALAFGQLGAREVSGETFGDPDIARLVAVTEVSECDECNANFPADRLGRTVITTTDGRRLDSGIVRAPGEHTNPIDRNGLIEKFRTLTGPVLDDQRRSQIEQAVFGLGAPGAKLTDLTGLLYPPAR
ncbi:MAG: MmgE/PrpD family protein [Alphaproteobacteria bacterium]|nr:MmgE/PrpD family protein [Alphaproteobacteria bacterium]